MVILANPILTRKGRIFLSKISCSTSLLLSWEQKSSSTHLLNMADRSVIYSGHVLFFFLIAAFAQQFERSLRKMTTDRFYCPLSISAHHHWFFKDEGKQLGLTSLFY